MDDPLLSKVDKSIYMSHLCQGAAPLVCRMVQEAIDGTRPRISGPYNVSVFDFVGIFVGLFGCRWCHFSC